MTSTHATAARRPTPGPVIRRRRGVATSLALTATLGLSALALALWDRGNSDAEPVVRLGAVTHEVTYQVDGEGVAPKVTFVTGAGNKARTLREVELPWSRTIDLALGPLGGFAQVEVERVATGVGSVGCRVLVDGEIRAHHHNADGFTGASCAASIAPEFVE